MRLSPGGLWRHPDFLKLWAGQTVSLLGSQFTRVALPLTAALVLAATPVQMGFLAAAGAAPGFLFGLVAGAWVDRARRRPLLIAADLAQALLLASVPLAAALGALRLEQLYAVAFLAATLGLGFSLASRSYLPALLPKADLVEGNSKLAVSGSAAELAGPALAGALVQILTPPLVLLLDALSFLASALALGRIRAIEPAPPATAARPGLWRAIGEGLRAVARDPLLRALAGASGLFNLFDNLIFAVYVLYVTREVGIAPAVLGLIFAAGGAGGLLGALLAGPLTGRVGLGPALTGGFLLATAGELLIPLAGGLAGAGSPPAVVAGLLMAAEVIVNVGAAVYGINHVSLRQAVTPDRLQGRVHATAGVIASGLGPLGALAGGFLGQAIGLRATLIVGGLGTLLAALWIGLSPVRSWRAPATPAANPAPDTTG